MAGEPDAAAAASEPDSTATDRADDMMHAASFGAAGSDSAGAAAFGAGAGWRGSRSRRASAGASRRGARRGTYRGAKRGTRGGMRTATACDDAMPLDAAEPDIAQLDIDQSDAAMSNAVRSSAVRSGAARPGAATPDDPRDADACRETALRLLDAAPRSSGALAERLEGKGYAPDVVAAVVARLIDVQLVDDVEYARSVVRACLGRMMGARGALQELQRKGVDRRTASQIVDEASEQGAFEDAAWQLGRQVARRTEGMDRAVRLRRLWSAGGRRGHGADSLRRVAQELL